MNQPDQTTKPDSTEENAKAPTAAQAQPIDKEKRAGSFLKTATRWLFGLLIVFSLGAVAAMYALYIPERQGLQISQADLTAANQKIADLESQVQKLTALESQNAALQKEVDAGNAHVKLLTALADVDTARVALAKNDSAAAKTALTNTATTLKEIASLAGSSQSETVKTIQDRLDIVMGEIETDPATTQTDLEVMATKLLELEKALFSQ